MPWPEFIRSYRRERGLTQTDLANLLRVDQATVSRWESGRQDPQPAMQTALRALFRELDWVPADQAIRALIKGHPGLASLIGDDLICRMASPRLSDYLQERGGSILGRPLPDIMTPRTADMMEVYLKEMLRPSSVVLSLSYTDRAIFSPFIVRRTWNVMRADTARMLVLQDHVLAESGGDLPPAELSVLTLDDLAG